MHIKTCIHMNSIQIYYLHYLLIYSHSLSLSFFLHRGTHSCSCSLTVHHHQHDQHNQRVFYDIPCVVVVIVDVIESIYPYLCIYSTLLSSL